MTSRRTLTGALLTLSLGAVVLAGCSGTTTSTTTATAKDQAAACSAQVTLDSTIPPGIDPDGPAPSAQDMQAWAAKVAPLLAVVQANAPDSLAPALQQFQAQLAQAQAGQRLDVNSDDGATASNQLDGWVHDSCGFQTLDVTNDGGTLSRVPATLKAGPVAVKFMNSGDPGKAGVVVLVARLKDGQTATPAQIDSGTASFDEVTEVVTAAQPVGPGPGYGVANLTAGTYVVSMPTGQPPNFTGMTSTGFVVS